MNSKDPIGKYPYRNATFRRHAQKNGADCVGRNGSDPSKTSVSSRVQCSIRLQVQPVQQAGLALEIYGPLFYTKNKQTKNPWTFRGLAAAFPCSVLLDWMSPAGSEKLDWRKFKHITEDRFFFIVQKNTTCILVVSSTRQSSIPGHIFLHHHLVKYEVPGN